MLRKQRAILLIQVYKTKYNKKLKAISLNYLYQINNKDKKNTW